MDRDSEGRRAFLKGAVAGGAAAVTTVLPATAAAQAAAMGSAEAADPETSIVALAAGPDLDEVDWDDAGSVCSVADADEEAAAALLKRRKLEAGLRQHPKRRATRPEPVDEAFIGAAVEKTKHRVQQRRLKHVRNPFL